MFLKLTNASKPFEGKPLILNIVEIMSIFEEEEDNGKNVTKIYSTTKDVWAVKETIDEVYNKINKPPSMGMPPGSMGMPPPIGMPSGGKRKPG